MRECSDMHMLLRLGTPSLSGQESQHWDQQGMREPGKASADTKHTPEPSRRGGKLEETAPEEKVGSAMKSDRAPALLRQL